MDTATSPLERLGDYFMKRSPIHVAAHRIVDELRALRVPCAVVGALAVNEHGLMRATEDVDILLTQEGLARFKERWLGRGWVERFAGSKGLRDTVVGVKVDVLCAGEFPGDGQPKPVVFPDPATVAVEERDGLPIVPLRLLLELKIASGMTAPHRLRDLDDAIRLIRRNGLPRDYVVDAYVRVKFDELWGLAQIDDER